MWIPTASLNKYTPNLRSKYPVSLCFSGCFALLYAWNVMFFPPSTKLVYLGRVLYKQWTSKFNKPLTILSAPLWSAVCPSHVQPLSSLSLHNGHYSSFGKSGMRSSVYGLGFGLGCLWCESRQGSKIFPSFKKSGMALFSGCRRSFPVVKWPELEIISSPPYWPSWPVCDSFTFTFYCIGVWRGVGWPIGRAHCIHLKCFFSYLFKETKK